MATIRKRNGRWHVQIRKAGARPVSKTFGYQKDAESWAKIAERQIEMEGCGHSKRQLLSSSFADLVSVYEEEEARHKTQEVLSRRAVLSASPSKRAILSANPCAAWASRHPTMGKSTKKDAQALLDRKADWANIESVQ